MAKIAVKCPTCQKTYQIDESLAGKRALCKNCNNRFVVGGSPSAAVRTGGSSKASAETARNRSWGVDGVPLVWRPGDVLLDLYEVQGVLGEGGMGTVYRVRHRGWGLDLAVKTPRPELLAHAGATENFEREAETWVNLGLHPHTVSCYYVRRLGGTPRVFAELVEGGSLQDWIRGGKLYEGGPRKALERILDIAIQFAWGLQHAHEQGLIHQDVKPANVMLAADGTVKVTDFGLAKARAVVGNTAPAVAGQSILVSVGGLTPAYCSPEQAERRPLSRKTDVWSWAVSVLELFTADVSWPAGQVAGAALEAYLEVGPGEERLPCMPAAMADLLRRCFRMQPEERPRDMLEIAAALQAVYQEVMGAEYVRTAPLAADMLADGLNNRAVSLLDLNRTTEAEGLFEQALKADAHHPEATYNRGLLLWRSARLTDDALVRQLEEVGASHPDGWLDRHLLGLVHLERGDAAAAVQALETAATSREAGNEVRQALAKARAGAGSWAGCLRTFKAPYGRQKALVLDAAGRRGLSADGSKFYLWDLEKGVSLRTFEGHVDDVHALALSPDERQVLSGSADATLMLWDLATGRALRIFEGHCRAVTEIAFSPDGKRILSDSQWDGVRLWDHCCQHDSLA